MTRRFSTAQRSAAYVYQDGKCALCGGELSTGFHMDHITPYSRGGETDIINGQALCPACNLKKGNKMNQNVELREWQQDAFQTFIRKGQDDFLQVATPGAGKTVFALYIAKHLLTTGEISRVIVVVPTNHLRKQWADTAHKLFGIQIQAGFSNQAAVLAPDYDGAAVTYQAVAANPELYRKMASDRSTMVILDEIHHAGEAKGWGESIRYAFSIARRRLSITGTPFRGDRTSIPFVRYSIGEEIVTSEGVRRWFEEGQCVPDHTYSYKEAMEDGVCREVYFHTFEGDLEWISGDGSERSATFSDELTDRENSERLRTALSTETDWLPGVIRQADSRLRAIRENEYPDAAGLIIAIDRFHAMQVARLVEKITGETPALAISDNPDEGAEDPSKAISRFKETVDPRWIVAVKMVSEGVDIPRLCVGVYATNVVSELFFRQAIGRFVRVVKDYEEVGAVVFAPKDPRIVDLIELVSKEVEAVIAEERERGESETTESTATESAFEPTFGQSIADVVYIGDEAFTQDQVDEIRRFISDSDIERVSLELALKLYRKAYNDIHSRLDSIPQEPTAPPATPAPQERSLEDQKKILRNRVTKAAKRICIRYDFEYKDIYKALARETGARVPTATIDQLKRSMDLLSELEERLEEEAKNANS